MKLDYRLFCVFCRRWNSLGNQGRIRIMVGTKLRTILQFVFSTKDIARAIRQVVEHSDWCSVWIYNTSQILKWWISLLIDIIAEPLQLHCRLFAPPIISPFFFFFIWAQTIAATEIIAHICEIACAVTKICFEIRDTSWLTRGNRNLECIWSYFRGQSCQNDEDWEWEYLNF